MSTISELLLFIISVFPVAIIGSYIYKKDNNKESSKLLLKLFIGGFSACLLVMIISLLLNLLIPGFSIDESKSNLVKLFFKVFFGIAFVEEFSKWIMVYKLSYNDGEFDELYDAIIYCTFVALGFACFENLFYVYQNGIGTGIARAFLAVPGHACDGIFMGYYLGLSKINDLNGENNRKNKYLILSILVPSIFHGIYDYCLLTDNLLFVIVFLIFVICLFVYGIKKIKMVSSINRKMKYKDNFCPNCGRAIDSNFCPGCGRKND